MVSWTRPSSVLGWVAVVVVIEGLDGDGDGDVDLLWMDQSCFFINLHQTRPNKTRQSNKDKEIRASFPALE